MPMQLLPKSAAAFAPRAGPMIVLNTIEPWLTQTLKRINKIKRPLNNPSQHHRCLTETLGGSAAIWTLTTLMLPKAPESELEKDEDPLVEAISNYDMLHVEAYVVHVDLVSQHEVAFKLTTDTIQALVAYHQDVYTVDAAAAVYDWPEKDSQTKKLHEDFVQAANRYVYRTDAHALEGLEEDGAGELLDARSVEVKKAIMNLFAPLSPPPPQIVDVILPAPPFSHNSGVAGWWQPVGMIPSHSHALTHPSVGLVPGSWHVLPSTPSPSATACSDSLSQLWQPNTASMDLPHLSSPTPFCDQADQLAFTTTAPLYNSPEAVVPVSSMLFPSQLPSTCGSMVTGGSFDGYGLGYNMFAPQYAATM